MACQGSGANLFRSTNNGTSWSLSAAGITNGSSENITMIGADVYLGTQSGLFKSTDLRVSWNRIGTTVIQNGYAAGGTVSLGADIYCNVVIPFVGGGIYKSSDAGANWTPVNVTLPGSNPSPFSLIKVNNTLYAGVFSTFASTVMQGVDGTAWTDIGQGLVLGGTFRVTTFLSRGNDLYAAFATNTDASFDLWKRTIVTAINGGHPAIADEFHLKQNYPNPFNPATTINYMLPKNGFVTLKIFDLLGKEAATLIEGEQASGTHSVTFNAEHIPSGIYFYTLRTAGVSETKKMILMK